MKKLISIFVVLLAVMGTMTTFTSCDEETTKEFLMDFYLVQAERYDAAMVKNSEGGSYEKWQTHFQGDAKAKNTSIKFNGNNFTCELTGLFAPEKNPCTFSAKGDYVTIQCDGKDFIRMTIIEPGSDVLEAKVEVMGKSPLWVKFNRILSD